MTSQIVEQGYEWFCHRTAEIQQEVAVLESQLGQLERKKAGSPALVQALGKYFGLGTAEKLNWVRFKLKLKRGELDDFEAKYGVVRQPGRS